MPSNQLYYGDNLDVLRRHVKDESVDLLYLDPPFKSGQEYNVLFQEHDGSQSAAQIQAFTDTWQWDAAAVAVFQEVVSLGGKVSQALQAFQMILGGNDMLAYLSQMALRLAELQRVLKPTGSIYLHCDPTASHYLKLLMDAVFGPDQFRNEIIWKRTSAHNSAKRFGPVHDTLLFYTKTDRRTWNPAYQPLPQETIDKWYNNIEPKTGRRFNRADLTAPGVRSGPSGQPWRGIDPTAKGRHWAIPGFVGKLVAGKDTLEALDALDAAGRIHWPKAEGGISMLKRYLDESKGIPAQDVIADISPLNNVSAERLGYPTQKPESLLERIILASSNEGDTVLDPFCGCGTAVAVAQRLNRCWIGIDITQAAIAVIKQRLQSAFGKVRYEVIGEPTTVPDAEALARENPFQFQWWIMNRLQGRPVEKKKGPDRGIDGRLYFHDEPDGGETKQVIVSVKSGNVGVSDVRELHSVVMREKAAIGVLVSLQDPTRPMRTEAAQTGKYRSPWGLYPRLQLLTIEELLAGDDILMPPRNQTNVTFKKAPKAKTKSKKPEQGEMFD